MPRLFAGLEIPPDIAERIGHLRRPFPAIRWVPETDLHITLRLFGDIDKRTAEDLIQYLANIEEPMFTLQIAGLKTRGSKDPHAIWAEVSPDPALIRLQAACERAARNAGLKPESRGYKPHVTLARLGRINPDYLARIMNRRSGFDTAPFPVPRFVLYSAKPHTGGGPYLVEETFPLLGGSWDDDDDDFDRVS
ncbi:MAG: RNA 2',3'-cyclic phosphodiesterase [Pseudomonadota bacterium]